MHRQTKSTTCARVDKGLAWAAEFRIVGSPSNQQERQEQPDAATFGAEHLAQEPRLAAWGMASFDIPQNGMKRRKLRASTLAWAVSTPARECSHIMTTFCRKSVLHSSHISSTCEDGEC